MNEQLSCQKIAEQVQELLQAETVVVAVAESSGEQVYHQAAVGKYADAIVGKRGDTATSGLYGTAFQESSPILVKQAEGDDRVRQDYVQAWGIYTALAVPLFSQGKIWGALMVLNRLDGRSFDEQDQQQLADYATQISAHIESTQALEFSTKNAEPE